MATETSAPDRAVRQVQQAFDAGARNGAPHLPLDHVDVGRGVLSATVAPPSEGDAGLDHGLLRAMHRALVLARATDERMWQMNRAGRAPFVVSGQGHEAAQVGAAFALDRGRDWIVPYYRDLALSMAFGLTAEEIILSALARATDPASGGRQMPAHYGSARRRIVSASSPVATQIPHATGLAYAAKLRGSDEVALTAFGEGGSSKGDFHEACNFAGIHRLAVIFFCENNRYAISVPQDLQMPIDNVADRAAAYGFPGVVVDGTDLLAVHLATRDAVARARAGEGPTLIEAKVYRFTPHSSDDDDRTYRDPEEVSAWRARDPVALFEQRMLDVGALDEESLAQVRAEIKREVDAATDAAEAAPLPDPATFADHVYAEG
jgi:2-oxoisovalerate dehydrogenase E1 component alpha subunit